MNLDVPAAIGVATSAHLSGDVDNHHEIYLTDPNRVAPENRKTVLRQPVGAAHHAHAV